MTLREASVRDGRADKARPSSLGGLDLGGCRVVPGRVNAHDHLELALFPRLGRGPHANAREWAEAIHRDHAEAIALHRRVDRADRLRWGGLKNLLSAATTVYEHNPYRADIFGAGFPVRVAQAGWAHSLDFSEDIAEAYTRRPAGRPFFLHAGEGTDARAAAEVFEFDRLGVLGPDTVLVHAVGFDDAGWRLIRARGVRVVWCPTSNLFTLGRTLNGPELVSTEPPTGVGGPVGPLADAGSHAAGPPTPIGGSVAASSRRGGFSVQIALGTDSPLTAAGDLFDELGAATETVGRERATALTGGFEPAAPGDWAVFEGDDTLRREALRGVWIDGHWRLLEARFAAEREAAVDGMQPLSYAGLRYWVRFDMQGLFARTHAILGEDFRLASKRVGLWR